MIQQTHLADSLQERTPIVPWNNGGTFLHYIGANAAPTIQFYSSASVGTPMDCSSSAHDVL